MWNFNAYWSGQRMEAGLGRPEQPHNDAISPETSDWILLLFTIISLIGIVAAFSIHNLSLSIQSGSTKATDMDQQYMQIMRNIQLHVEGIISRRLEIQKLATKMSLKIDDSAVYGGAKFEVIAEHLGRIDDIMENLVETDPIDCVNKRLEEYGKNFPISNK